MTLLVWRRRAGRVWAAPLPAHVVALGLLLLALVPLVGTSASFSPDEGVAIIQARSLQDGGGWVVEHPFASIDPDDRFYPLSGSSQGDEGQAPFAKHPVYPLVLTALDRLGGTPAMVVLSVLATVAAAALGALVARTAAGGLERPVLWVIGLGSPLLFDAYLLIAHSLGAALVTGAALAALHGIRRPRVLPFLGAALLMAVAVLMRSEALIFALALGVGIGVTALARRHLAMLAGAVGVPLAGLAAALAEKQMQVAFIGAARSAVSPPSIDGGFLAARIEGLLNTWFRPVPGLPTTGDLVLLLVPLLIVAAAVVVRRRPQRPRLFVALAVAAMACSLVAFALDPDHIVPGLLLAFPMALVAIVLVDRRSFDAEGRLLLTVTAGLFLAGILATQYREGGSAEWGGRYFALAVPLIAVLAVDALHRRSSLVPAVTRRTAMAGLVGCSALLAVGSVASISRVHSFTDRLLDRIVATGEATTPGDGEARPVVLSSQPNIPRLAWDDFDRCAGCTTPMRTKATSSACCCENRACGSWSSWAKSPRTSRPTWRITSLIRCNPGIWAVGRCRPSSPGPDGRRCPRWSLHCFSCTSP